jgi:hypothetical protein
MASRTLTYDFPLRRALIVRLTLPVDLAPWEADRLSRFVSALAMPEELLVEAAVHASDCAGEDCECGTLRREVPCA